MGEIPSRPRGRLITLEGGEGAGKSTQAQKLVERLAARGLDTVQTREPGGSPRAERLRAVILSGAAAPLGPAAEALLFAAARADHIDVTIEPALREGAFVVCDRYIDSTRAYQGALGKVSPILIEQLEKVVVGAVRPDLTIMLDMPEGSALARAAQRRGVQTADRFEREGADFHRAIREAFLTIARAEPERCVIIDADRDANAVAADIWAAVEARLLQPPPALETPPAEPPRAAEPVRRAGPHLRVIAGSRGEGTGARKSDTPRRSADGEQRDPTPDDTPQGET